MPIEPGLTARRSFTVTDDVSADRMGNPGFAVYSTPALVGAFEATAVDAIAAHLDAGKGSVGTYVDVRHLAATPMGMTVTIDAKLIDVDGRRLTFELEARDEMELIGSGKHERFVVDTVKFLAKVAAKAT
jgi:fluoroacetyl-CoA thioesterase